MDLTMMRRWRGAALLGILLAVAPAVRPLAAAERYMAFVHALEDKGYPDVALDYLDMLQGRSDLPAGIREVLDLERFNSYRAWARMTSDGKLAQHRNVQAQAYLDKFVKERPNDPRGGAALAFRAELTLDRGRDLLITAKSTTDKARQKQLFAEARTVLQEACQRFDESTAMFRDWLAQVRAKPKAEGPLGDQREELELSSIEVRFKAGQANYYLARTYPQPDDPQRKAALEKTAKLFDGIYQDYREATNNACLFAHLWHARTLEELGDKRGAMDIYEEILGGAPDTDEGAPEAAAIYAEAALSMLRAAGVQANPAEFVEAANNWLEAHKSWSKLSGYQGIVIEVAKTQLALAEKAKGEVRNKIMRQAIAGLRTVAAGNSEYKAEAILLNRQVMSAQGKENATVEECFVLGDAALAAKQLPDAEENYSQALKLATAAGDKKLMAQSKLRGNRVRYAKALMLYSSGKHEEALQVAGALATEDASDASAGRAALLGLSAAAAEYSKRTGKEQEAELERVKKIVEFVAKKWAGQPEADDALLTLAQAHLIKGDTEAAMACFGRIDSRSPRYATVLSVLGQLQWKAYWEEKKKEGTPNAERMNESRTKARKYFEESAGLLRKEIRGDAVDATSQLAEMQLLLAEVYMEGKEYKEAVALLDPLVAKVKALKPSTIEAATFRTFMTAVRAHLALGETNRAAETALVLVELGQDTPQFNGVLVNFARLIAQQLKRAETAVGESAAEAKPPADAAARRAALQEVLGKMLESLVKRESLSIRDMVYLGDLCAAAGRTEQAAQQYQRLLKKVQDDPDWAKKAGPATIRVRAQLVGLLRTQGKFADAVKQADELVAANPRALEPRMAKAFVLDEWAAQDREKYDAAIAQWTEVRTLLGRLQRKPPEYYTAVFRTADCLYRQAKLTKDASKLLQAEQVLKSTLVMHSKAMGEDMFGQYKDLLGRIAAAKGSKDQK